MSKHAKGEGGKDPRKLYLVTKPGLYMLFGRLNAAPHPKEISQEVVEKGMYTFYPTAKEKGRKLFRTNCVKALLDGSLALVDGSFPTPALIIGHRFGHWVSIGPFNRATIRRIDEDGTWSSFVESMQDCYPGSKFMRIYVVVHPDHSRSYLGAIIYTQECDEDYRYETELATGYVCDKYYYPRDDSVQDLEEGADDGKKQLSIKDFFNKKGY